MSDYTVTTDFSAKDDLATGDPEKIIKGSDVDTEFDNIATAVNSKLDDVLTTRGDLLREGASGEERVALGSSGEVLQSDGTDAVWGSPPPITTQGDVVTGDASGNAQRLALGSSGQSLQSDGTDAVWSSAIPDPGFESAEQTVTADTKLDVAHGLGAKPTLVQVILRNKTGDLGYSAGDEVVASNFNHGGADTGVTVFVDATNVSIVQGLKIQLINASTFNTDDITVANWRWVVRAWA